MMVCVHDRRAPRSRLERLAALGQARLQSRHVGSATKRRGCRNTPLRRVKP